MKAYVVLSYINFDREIKSYTVFMQTKKGIITEVIDVHESELEEFKTLERDLECINMYLTEKFHINIEIKYLKANYDVIW